MIEETGENAHDGRVIHRCDVEFLLGIIGDEAERYIAARHIIFTDCVRV